MSNFWLKLKIWTKSIIISVIVLYALFFIAKNSDRSVKLWIFFNKDYETSVLFFTFWVFFIGVVGTLLVRTTFATMRQVRELRARNRSGKLEREVADMQAKAAMLKRRGGNPGDLTPDAATAKARDEMLTRRGGHPAPDSESE